MLPCLLCTSCKIEFHNKCFAIIARAHASYLFSNGQVQITYNTRFYIHRMNRLSIFFVLQFDLLGNFPMTISMIDVIVKLKTSAWRKFILNLFLFCWLFQHWILYKPNFEVWIDGIYKTTQIIMNFRGNIHTFEKPTPCLQ